MNALKRFWKNRKGNFSILFVTLVFVGVLVATAFLDILFSSWSMQEIQSTMDVAGVSALRTGVDETKLRLEIFEVDKNVVENSYKRMVSNFLDNSEKIIDYRYTRTKVDSYVENWGLGVSSKARPQAIIDSSMVITVEGSSLFDMVPGAAKVFYDSRSGSNFEVKYVERTQDGDIQLAIRSVSRIVYR
ncbi:hypothetical protein NDS46_30775 (plasmid) [Paenibacillus thiaminolyticus]|uniref:hypothetical protein n=1 Tax=Paenibacillus thiaminolyticus TaxID=49283 RepID=UPI00232BBA14|nr:hypothetical protein [Paenibacillus thiaminolyticus]WCF11731.1 hypothetical protein NDS46_30775 [Paenibacillus thiaminolyticus]